jgi:phosphopantothenoylcysteine decarboxylase / phosphopantothenate---cysteine ligase
MAKKVLFFMSGSIAGFKACQVISDLKKLDTEIQVVASPSTFEFVGAASLEGLSGKPVISSLFESGKMMDHIHLMRWADIIVLCPATANTLNQFAYGSGDSLLTTFFLAHDFKKPFLVFPAMNTSMYEHPVTQRSIGMLKEMGLKIYATNEGNLACGEVGSGRMLEPFEITKQIQQYWNPK